MTLHTSNTYHIESKNNSNSLVAKLEKIEDNNIIFKALVSYENDTIKEIHNNDEFIIERNNATNYYYQEISESDFNTLKNNEFVLGSIGLGNSAQEELDEEVEDKDGDEIQILNLFSLDDSVTTTKGNFSFGKKEKINLNNFFKNIDEKHFIILNSLIKYNGQKIFMALNNDIQHRAIKLKIEHTKTFEEVVFKKDEIYIFKFLDNETALAGNFIGRYKDTIYFFDIIMKNILKFNGNLFIEKLIYVNESHPDFENIRNEIKKDNVIKKTKEIEKKFILEKHTKMYNKRHHIKNKNDVLTFDKTWNKIIAIYQLDNDCEILKSHNINLIDM